MTDPLAEVVALLQPTARLTKLVRGSGQWRVRRTELGEPFYCVVLDGASRLSVDGHDTLSLLAGDFVLIPAAHAFTMTSRDPPAQDAVAADQVLPLDGEVRLGPAHGTPDYQALVGHCAFASKDASLLVPLLPKLVHVRGEPRLATLVELVRGESRDTRPARDVVLGRLLEVLLIEALRSTTGTAASPGLLRGLTDERVAIALRHMHALPGRAWTVAQLAKDAALSRSAFFERFSRAVGLTPMEYLLAWRMALAKRLLRTKGIAIATVAEQVGYRSPSTFSVAFSRHVGMPPMRYAKEQLGA